MKVAVVFEPDPDLGTDPLDDADPPDQRSQGLFLDTDKLDVLLIYRTYGEQYDDGYRTHIFASGIWENVTIDQMSDAIDHITQLGGDDGDH